jgi:low molecular weight protein-tyrosine phosphatase
MRLLFVCSGNICRSPLAEAIFAHRAAEAGVGSRFAVDSAGTHDYHEGDLADPRTRRVGARHGIEVTSVAREVRPSDFEDFDLILAMDRGHRRELLARSPAQHRHKIEMMRAYDRPGADPDVPDPYYGGFGGFEEIYEILSSCCAGLLESLLTRGEDSAPRGDQEPA